MEEKFDKALAAKIRALAEESEYEPYEIGAWESFEAKTFGSGNHLFRFLWIGLAASFLMAMSVNTIYNTTNFKDLNSSSFSFQIPEVDNYSIEENNKVDFENATAHKNSSINTSFVSSPEKGNTKNIKLVSYSTSKQRFFRSNFQRFSFFPDLINSENYSREDQMIKYSSGFIPYPETPQEMKKKGKEMNQRQIKVGVVLASSLNSIDMNKSGCNIGAGLMADVPLLKGISLNTGLILNAQRIKFESSRAGKNVETNGKMVSVDLPVNLKYNVCSKHDQQFFVSAGISSLAYVKEEFTDQGNIIEGSEGSEDKSDESFSGLDLAKFMNLSMGVEIPLERQFSLLIEPYLKYPLGNSTSREIKYASAGLSLRLNMGLALLN
ncbi:MAG TPA: outer membrane beta-barrel protein [Cytophagales bacterium]|nr:outer membrane beta-barrel protein [Cytophagales bacterium]